MIIAKNTQSDLVKNDFKERRITHAFHDIDGTHSLIREWPPVMSIVLYDVIENGLPEGYDSAENVRRLVDAAGTKSLPETDRFCVVSAGLSALTQMEWSIRRAAENGRLPVAFDRETNAVIIKQIWEGKELFGSYDEPEEFRSYIQENTPRLFRFYEAVLNGYCRDKNLILAKEDPQRFMVNGSMEFMRYLHENGVKNYFVTGAVVEKGMGMHEEVVTLGYAVGEGELIEDLLGSTWDKKIPKDVVMRQLVEKLSLDGANILVIGDGRSEIEAGVAMGALTVSRLPADAAEQRALHDRFGTNIIIEDYCDPALYQILASEDGKAK